MGKREKCGRDVAAGLECAMTSWVVVSRETGQAVLETFSRKIADAVNLDRYRVVPILQWLGSINSALRERQ